MNNFLTFVFAIITIVTVIITLALCFEGMREGLDATNFQMLTYILAVGVLSALSFIHLINVEKPTPPTKQVPIITTNCDREEVPVQVTIIKDIKAGVWSYHVWQDLHFKGTANTFRSASDTCANVLDVMEAQSNPPPTPGNPRK